MRIQKIIAAFLILFTVVFSINAKAIAMNVPSTTTIAKGNTINDSLQIVHMQQRVADIQHMDVKNMSSSQRHTLRVELKDMLSQAKAMDDDGGHSGVYLSVGGLIIIILLLILILR